MATATEFLISFTKYSWSFAQVPPTQNSFTYTVPSGRYAKICFNRVRVRGENSGSSSLRVGDATVIANVAEDQEYNYPYGQQGNQVNILKDAQAFLDKEVWLTEGDSVVLSRSNFTGGDAQASFYVEEYNKP
jgi:hypothetical protein